MFGTSSMNILGNSVSLIEFLLFLFYANRQNESDDLSNQPITVIILKLFFSSTLNIDHCIDQTDMLSWKDLDSLLSAS